MPGDVLTEDTMLAALRAFFREKPFLFIGSGMSCALDTRLGMPALRDALVERMRYASLTPTQQEQWASIERDLSQDGDLESAMNGATDSGLHRVIIGITGTYISEVDRELACLIAARDAEWPATRFLKRLTDTLPESDPVLHVLTPNYDLLLEYACDCEGIHYTTGFTGGVSRRLDWQAAEQSLLVPGPVTRRGRTSRNYRSRKHVRLYKVHGSLNYFLYRNSVVQNDAWLWAPPAPIERVIICPGISKYEALQRYRQELLATADTVIERERQFLFLGYGFNDVHLEEYIRRKLVMQRCKGLVITRDSNPRIEALLAEAENLWLICRSDDGQSVGTCVSNRRYCGCLHLPGRNLWDIREFTAYILGGS
ncbi:MAG: SIR2 family protein [Anaerolineae bacterium]